MIIRMLQYNQLAEENAMTFDINDMFHREQEQQRTAITQISQSLGLLSATAPNNDAEHMQSIIVRDLELTDVADHDRLLQDLVAFHSGG